MIISGKFFIAVRCENCNKLEIYDVSLFKLTKKEKNAFICSCGKTAFWIQTNDYKTFYFSMPCSVCDIHHVFSYTLKEMYANHGKIGQCSFTGIDLLFIGAKPWIKAQMYQKHKEKVSMMKELGFYYDFHNPEVMIESINRIHRIANQGALYCGCGSKNIQMHVFEDRIELQCMDCKGIHVIYAETREDFMNLMTTHAIVMHEKTFSCMDAISYKKS